MPKDPTIHHSQRGGSDYTGANSGRGSRANANKKKKAKKMIVPVSPAEPRKQWWEIWEEVQNQGVKTFFCDQDVHVYDKMYLATDTFNKSRSWPATETQVRARWDQFQVYVGLLTNAAGDELDRLAAFVRDPARTVQVYLSSYMIHKGLHFTGHFCDIIPRLLSFYVNFLITNQVLPDQEPNLRLALEVTELARVELPLFPLIAHACPDNLNLACKEVFSATPRLTKDLSANATGGTGLEVPSGTASIAEDSEAVSLPTMNVTGENEGSNKVARKGKKKSKSKKCKRNEEQDIFQDSNELKDEKSTVGQGPASEMSGWGDTCGWAMNTVTSTQDGDDENNGSSIWGTTVSHDPSTGGWGEASSNYGAGSWGSPHEEQNTTNSWAEDTDISAPGLGTFTLPPPASSFVPASIIGPTGLPATHVGGIVEYSIRRIKDIRPMDITDLPMNPAQTAADDQSLVKSEFESESESEISGLGPAAIETELKQKYWRVTLAPWLHPWGHPADSVNGASYLPRILASTMGRLGNIQSPGFPTDASNTVSEAVVEKGAVVDLNVGSVKPHDPFIDDVVIFLEEEACKTMRVGMGLGGTWVQLLWKSDVEVKMEVDAESEGRETRFWYMQDLLSNLTSYHIV